MKNIFTNSSFDAKAHLGILKTLLISANVLVLGLDLLVHIVFYDFSYNAGEELIAALTLMGWTSLFAVAISFAGFLADAAIHIYNKPGIKQQQGVSRTFTLDTHTPARA